MRYFSHLYQLASQPRSIFGDPNHELNTRSARIKFCAASCFASGALVAGSDLLGEFSETSPSLQTVFETLLLFPLGSLMLALILAPVSVLLSHMVGETDRLRFVFLVFGIGILGPYALLPFQLLHLPNSVWIILCPSLYAALIVWPSSLTQAKIPLAPYAWALLLLFAVYGVFQSSEKVRERIGNSIVDHLDKNISPGTNASRARKTIQNPRAPATSAGSPSKRGA